MTIDDYIDRARATVDINTYGKLSKELNLSEAAISQFRSKKMYPSDATMIDLAALAGMDIGQALCDLNIWRSKSAKVAAAYAQLAERVKLNPDE